MKKNILVTGDYIVDHHILKGLKSEASEDGKTGSTIVKTHGGAYMTFSLMEKVVPMLNSHKQEEKDMVNLAWGMNVDVKTLMSEGTIHDSYLQWSLDCVGKDNKEYFRLKEKLGFGNLPDNSKIKWLEPAAITNKLTNTVAILDEANLGFRNTPKAWPDFTKACRIILKTTQPLCKGELWTRLLEKKDQLVTIVSLQQLKHYNIKVSNDISWEQTALDITTGLTEHRDLNALMQSGTLIVTIGSAGALIIVNGTKEKFAEFTLVFDPETMENEWEMQKAEKIINLTGLGSSFLAGFSLWYAHSDFNVTDAVKAGLNMVNSSLINGLFNSYAPPFIYNDHSGAFNSTIEKRRYVSAFIPSPYWKSLGTNPPNHEWTILENNYDVNKPQKNKKKRLPLFSLAQSLAVHGTDNIKYAPLLQMGDVVTFDRVEIEGLRNIRKQVEFFVTFEKGTKPLNIAVFGPPGAGKSFIVKALAKSLFKNTHIVPEFLTFNLSQFRDSAGLPGAFHAIRDAVLNGKLPIVFWDEFDTDNYKWLKTMLAPMQDGVFQDAQETHPIGKAIFIFAGGVTYTMEHFVENTKKKDSAELKIPDFLSRIQCYLNVLGPNKRPVKKGKSWQKQGDKTDVCYPVRRALFIRTILGKGNLLSQMDQLLLRALLEVDVYTDGSRSLERILKPLAIHPGKPIERSDLPSDEMLKMNLDYASFDSILKRIALNEDLLYEKLAIGIHKSWMEHAVKDSVFFKQYEELGIDGRFDNVSAARRMKGIIASSGTFEMVPDRGTMADAKEGIKAFDEFIKDDKTLDKLAEREHLGWMETRREAEWKPGERSDYFKLHNCMVAFSELDIGIKNKEDQTQKKKDRSTIQNYTKMLEGTGFTIVKKKK